MVPRGRNFLFSAEAVLYGTLQIMPAATPTAVAWQSAQVTNQVPSVWDGQMSLETFQTTTGLQSDMAAPEQVHPDPMAAISPASVAQSAWSTQAIEQTFETLRRIFEANSAVTRAFYDAAQRQQAFVMATTEASLSGLPRAVAHQINGALTRVGEVYGQNIRMLGLWTGSRPERPRTSTMAEQQAAAP